MTAQSPMPTAAGGPSRAAPARPGRLFHTAAAVTLLVLMFLGFRAFYLHGQAYPGRPLTPPIRDLLIVHGTGMTLWTILLVVQTALVASRRTRVHMKLGWATAAVAAVSVVFGWKLGIESARVAPPDLRIWGFPAKQFMIVPIVSIVLFAAGVAAGVALRKRPQAHRAMMLTATLAAIPAAVSRIDFLNELYVGTVFERLFGPFFMTLVVGIVLVAVRSATTRSLDRWLAGGVAALGAASVVMTQMAPSAAWDAVASALLGS